MILAMLSGVKPNPYIMSNPACHNKGMQTSGSNCESHLLSRQRVQKLYNLVHHNCNLRLISEQVDLLGSGLQKLTALTYLEATIDTEEDT